MNSSVWRDVRSQNRGQSGSRDMIVRLRDGNRIWRVSPDTRQIEQAEMMRLSNPKVMDLYGACGADENAESTTVSVLASALSQVRSASEIWLEFI